MKVCLLFVVAVFVVASADGRDAQSGDISHKMVSNFGVFVSGYSYWGSRIVYLVYVDSYILFVHAYES